MRETVNALFAPNKGILAADESFPSIEKRFTAVGIESNEVSRRAYRQMLFTSPNMNQYISGVILFDETIKQALDDGKPIPQYLIEQGVVPGIKVDLGTIDLSRFEGEKTTQGLDGLRERLQSYYQLGARFSKWRAVFKISQNTPSDWSIETNANDLARFALLSQEANIVPIVEPEVLMEGEHDMGTCEKVTIKVHEVLFKKLSHAKVVNEELILKTNMVLAGSENINKPTAEEMAQATTRALKSGVPTNVGGIVFLSGGLDETQSTKYLNEICKTPDLPWKITFSFGRALQNSALQTWAGKSENIQSAQNKFLEMASNNSKAVGGKYE
jgi:fructose-bisphosphate aldolase class I